MYLTIISDEHKYDNISPKYFFKVREENEKIYEESIEVIKRNSHTLKNILRNKALQEIEFSNFRLIGHSNLCVGEEGPKAEIVLVGGTHCNTLKDIRHLWQD